MEKFMKKIVLVGSFAIMAQGFGMFTKLAEKISTQQTKIDGLKEGRAVREEVTLTEYEDNVKSSLNMAEQLEELRKENDRLKSKLRKQNVQDEALRYYNAYLLKNPDVKEEDYEAKVLPNVDDVEKYLCNFFENIDKIVPNLESLKTKSLEEKERCLNEMATVINNLHHYMDTCLIPLMYGIKKTYENAYGPVIKCRTSALIPPIKNQYESWHEEYVPMPYPLTVAIEKIQEQLPILDALLQAAELSYQTECKKEIFRENNGHHVLYLEVWNDTSRQNPRIKEIERVRKEVKGDTSPNNK